MMLSALLTRVFCMGEERKQQGACPLVVLYDEAHKFFEHRPTAKLLTYLVRERRHLGLNLIFGSQDPMSVTGEVIGLLDVLGLLQTDCPEWLRYLSRYNEAFKRLKVKHTGKLPAGVMWLWAKHWAVIDEEWWDRDEPFLPLQVRPRVTLHGGETRGAGAT
jgi:hypothetical protein